MIMIKNYRIIPAFATVSFLLAQEIVSLMMDFIPELKSKMMCFSSFFKKILYANLLQFFQSFAQLMQMPPTSFAQLVQMPPTSFIIKHYQPIYMGLL
jgi:hypothetical protein